MNSNAIVQSFCRLSITTVLSILGLFLALSGDSAQPAALATESRSEEAREPVAKALPTTSLLLRRENPQKNWQLVRPQETLYSRDLLLCLPGAHQAIISKNGAVRLSLYGNTPSLSSRPILESAVVLHDNSAFDLDCTLLRGEVIFANEKKKGSARVQIHLPSEVWELTLADPGSEAVLNIYGRWPRGVPFTADAKAGESPTFAGVLFVRKGKVDLRGGGKQRPLAAPPGAASLAWDSVVGQDASPAYQDKIPDWATPEAVRSRDARFVQDAMNRLAPLVQQKKSVALALGALFQSASSAERDRAQTIRRLVVYSMSAIDQLAWMMAALQNPDADVRETAVEAMRHWIGRSAEQDQKLYQWLMQNQHYSPAHAEIFLQLLHSYDDNELAKPETYEALIAYLRHARPAIRELAVWHLYRLVPAGKKIAYDPLDNARQCDRAYQEWKKLIPSGKLPGENKSPKK